MAEVTYMQLNNSHVWHYHPMCQHYRSISIRLPQGTKVTQKKPRSGEFCDECRAKERQDKLA